MLRTRISLLLSSLALLGCADGASDPAQSGAPSSVVRSVRPGDALVDPRDAKSYPTIWIGSRLWMAMNLDFDTLDSSLTWCPGDTAANCTAYGRLYSWRVAMRADSTIDRLCDVWLDSTGICPDGWHLPSKAEWTELADTLEGAEGLGRVLRSLSGWSRRMDGTSGNGIDSVGFSALPAGYHFTGDQGYGHTASDSAFFDEGSVACFWTRTNALSGSCWSAWGVFLSGERASAEAWSIPRSSGLSVRCVRN